MSESKFPVVVVKTYDQRRGRGYVEVYGVIEVEAQSQEEARDKVRAMIEAVLTSDEFLTTTDERIWWASDHRGDEGWAYQDFSFGVAPPDIDPEDLGWPGAQGVETVHEPKDDLANALAKFRERLGGGVTDIVETAGVIKSDEVVDDGACDGVVASARAIAIAFNELAPLLNLPPVGVPDELQPSPYQAG